MSRLTEYTDLLRTRVEHALASTDGNQHRPVRIVREILGTANDLAGRPFCTEAELLRRRARSGGAVAKNAVAREPAPVMVYFDGQDHRTLRKVEELLKAREIPWKTLDVTDDESTRSWALTAARAREFPLVFVAGEPIGGLHELTQSDVNGQLRRRVYG